MDAKNIYIAYQHYSSGIKWEMNGESEWIYLGTAEEFKEERVVELINSFFEEDELYLITDRNTSTLIKKKEATEKVKKLLTDHNPVLANSSFSKIMEFNKIGVVRKGQRRSV